MLMKKGKIVVTQEDDEKDNQVVQKEKKIVKKDKAELKKNKKKNLEEHSHIKFPQNDQQPVEVVEE